MDELSGSLSTLSKGGTATTAVEGEFGLTTDDVTYAPRHTQSLQEMWENSDGGGGSSGVCGKDGEDDQDRLYSIIMSKERGDRLLPWELCEVYEREMIERIDHRQAENNVPIIPLPIC